MQHRQANRIVRLKKQEEIEHTLTNHFRKLMEEPDMDRSVEMREILENIPSLVTQEKNKLLHRPIKMEEPEEAVKQLKNDKAPGPYGFITNFFHAC